MPDAFVKSRIARFAFVPTTEKSANTLSCWMSWRTFCTVRDGSYASSRYLNVIFRPFTPPRAFTYLKYASAPRRTPAAAAASPVRGPLEPMVISVDETPGVPEEAAPAMPASRSAATAAARARVVLVIRREGSGDWQSPTQHAAGAAASASGRPARRRRRTSPG